MSVRLKRAARDWCKRQDPLGIEYKKRALKRGARKGLLPGVISGHEIGKSLSRKPFPIINRVLTGGTLWVLR